ncbi:MAG: type II toxin-antitoxin system RelE/ParE family toxin [Candidatus Thermoplasmatota archaeon]|nr:type II toxin-antitoxin system RelE/ParE family toxin [Candidatus Thermoplasmatota archaeon]
MNYRIKVTKQFEKDFTKLKQDLKEGIIKKVDLLKENPYKFKRLHGRLRGKYSLRIGDYRIVYSINEDEKEVILYCFGHRKKVYKKK